MPIKNVFSTPLVILLLVTSVGWGQDNPVKWFRDARPCWAAEQQVTPNVTVHLKAEPLVRAGASVSFRITASSAYRFFLNGAFVGHGPSIAAHGFFRVDEYDLTGRTIDGPNSLAVEVAGYNIDNYFIPNQASFVQAELLVDGQVAAATQQKKIPNAFRMYRSLQRIAEVPKLSFQRTHLEAYRLTPDFSAWRSGSVIPGEPVEVEETDRKNLLPRNVRYPDYSMREARRHPSGGIFSFQIGRAHV